MRPPITVCAPLLRLAVSLVLGILLGEWWAADMPWLGVLAALVVATLCAWRLPLLQSVGLCLCMVALGALLVGIHRRSLMVNWPQHRVTFEAVIVSEPVGKPRTIAVDLLLPGSGHRLKGYVSKDGRSQQLRVGDGLLLTARISANRYWRRGSFDYARYLQVHDFTGTVYVPADSWRRQSVSLTGLSRWNRAKLRFMVWRHRLVQRLRLDGMGGNETSGVVAAMTLGDKSALSQELRDVYAVTGVSHVLALSGLHLGIIYGVLSLLLAGRRFQVLSQLLIVLSIWAFVLLVGMQASVVRSAVMLSVYALLSLAHRGRMSVNVLAFTAILMLCFNPYALFDAGFQLSFVAVLSIVLWVPLMESLVPLEYMQRHVLLRWVWGMVAVSLAAQLGVAPLVAYYFGRFSTYFLLVNFVAVPAVTLVLYLSLATLLLPAMGRALMAVAACLNAILTYIAIHFPLASIENLHPSALQTALLYVVVIALYLLFARLRQVRWL